MKGAPLLYLALGALIVAMASWELRPRAGGRAAAGERARVLTVAHFSLQSGFRQGFNAVAAAYEERHPDVDVEVLEVPGAVWSNWLMTKLVGGLAPDLIQIGLPTGGSMSAQAYDELLSRYFQPFREEMNRPNPYAGGTSQGRVPWRQTFVDGLAWPPSYSLTNFEIYGVPFTLFANRLAYNRELMIEITGREEPPRDYREFLQVCAQTREYRKRTGRPIVPIAAASNTGPALMESYFGSVTQWLRVEIDPHRQFTLYPTDLLRAAVGGNFDFDREEIRAGLELAREVGLQCMPGFMQLQRDSAVFHFGQGLALMMLSNPADITTLRADASFPIGVCGIPWPTSTDPVYGRFIMGPLNESQGGLQNSLGITQASPNRELAIDFLQFASSPEGASLFARESGLPPAVVVAQVADEVEALKPLEGGYPPGLQMGYGRPEMARIFDRHFHHLVSPSGSVDAFVAAMRTEFAAAAVEAAHGFQRNWRRSIRQRDGVIGAYTWLQTHGDDAQRATADERWGVLLDNDSQADAHLYILDRFLQDPRPLRRHESPPVGARRR